MKGIKKNRFREPITSGVSLLAALCLAAVGTVRAADFHWTGAASNHLWSTAENWANAPTNNTMPTILGDPKTVGPQPGEKLTYNFADYPHGLVVTQDIDVVVGSDIATHVYKTNVLSEVTWVSASNCTMGLSGWGVNVHCMETSRLVLNVDLRKTGWDAGIVKHGPGSLAFNLKTNFTGKLNVQKGAVEIAETSADVNLDVAIQGGGLFENRRRELGLSGLRVSSGRDAGRASNCRIDFHDTAVTVDGTSTSGSAFEELPIPIFANGGRLDFIDERTRLLYGLPIGGTLETVRADALVSNTLTVVRWTFDNPTRPTADLVGYGERLLAPKGMPEVVEDSERGHVLKFVDGQYFKGPDARAGFDPLFAGNAMNRPYTVAFWIKPDAACDPLAKIFFWGTNQDGEAAALRLNVGSSETETLMFTTWNYNWFIATPTNPMDGNWHHIAVTYDGDVRFAVYYDGVPVKEGTRTARYIDPNQNFYIGAIHGGWVDNGANPYTGLMDDLFVAAYAATSNDVATLYRDGLAAFAPVPSLVVRDSGTTTIYKEKLDLAALSGDGVRGGVEMPWPGSVLKVGEGTNTFASYTSNLRGADTTFVKTGTNFVQELGGRAESVTNVVVDAGVLRLRRPLARRGLVARYAFEKDLSSIGFDESPSVFALAGRGAAGGPTWVADGVSGSAARFDGEGYLSSDGNPFPSTWPVGNGSYSVSVWVRPTAETCANEAPIFCWGEGKDRRLSYLRFASATRLKFSNFSEDFEVTVPEMANGAWHHVAVVYDGDTRRKTVYVDGASVGSTTAGAALDVPRMTSFRLGHGCINNKTYAGDMDECQVFNYALTAEEVAAECAGAVAVAGVLPSLPTPVAHWTFDDDANPGAATDAALNLVAADERALAPLEAGDLICGKAARFTSTNGFFKLAAETFPAVIPTGKPKDFTVVVRYRPDTVQQDSLTTIVAWGNPDKWWEGGIFKFGTDAGRVNSVRPTVGSAVVGSGSGWGRSGAADVENAADRRRWIVAAIVYAESMDNSNRAWIYCDGRLVGKAERFNMNLEAKDFVIGSNAAGAQNFRGLVDDVRIYDTTLSASEIRRLVEQYDAACGDTRAVDAQTAVAVLPRNPSVTVAADAVLDVRSDETVVSVAGTGTINVAPCATLSMQTFDDAFAATVTGAGSVGLAAGATLSVTDATTFPRIATSGRFHIAANVVVDWTRKTQDAGWVSLVTADGGFDGEANLEKWTNVGRVVKFRISSYGKTLQASASSGLTIILR